MKRLLAVLLVSFCGQTGLAQDGADHSPAPAAAPSANVPVPASSVSPGRNSPVTLALQALKELEAVDAPKYCPDLAGNQEHSSSLAKVCEFVFNLRKRLSNIICDRQTKRYWTERSTLVGLGTESETADIQRSDVVKVNVTYRDGQEYYSDVRLDGQPVPANAPEVSGSWSHGEFATMLAGVFAPSSKTQFRYSKQTKLRSIPALVFDFKVASQNNRLYYLQSRDKIWFPEYGGKIWVDARTSSLLRLQLETAHMPDHPTSRTKAEIEYSNLLLGDGTSMVLPTNSSALICINNCTRSVTKFTHWHKFRATTKIVVTPAN
jgi:hypothetical protein